MGGREMRNLREGEKQVRKLHRVGKGEGTVQQHTDENNTYGVDYRREQ